MQALQGIDLTTASRRLGLRGLLAATMVATAAVVHATRPIQGQIFITVMDTDRHPVLGLVAEDFAMRDGAVRQPVLDVEPATAPLSVVIVIDGFEAGDARDVGRAIEAAARALGARDRGHRVSLLTGAGPGDRPLVAVALDQPGLDASVARLVAGGGGRLFERVSAACQALEAAPADRRVVLALVRRRADEVAAAEPAEPAARMTDAILRARAALWTVEVAVAVPPAGRSTPSAPAQVRSTLTLDDALDDGVRLSGALREPSPSIPALADAVTRVTALLLSQYLVTYTWPDPMLSQVSLSIRHDRGVVLTPAWSR
jgi:hypothetical protein